MIRSLNTSHTKRKKSKDTISLTSQKNYKIWTICPPHNSIYNSFKLLIEPPTCSTICTFRFKETNFCSVTTRELATKDSIFSKSVSSTASSLMWRSSVSGLDKVPTSPEASSTIATSSLSKQTECYSLAKERVMMTVRSHKIPQESSGMNLTSSEPSISQNYSAKL